MCFHICGCLVLTRSINANLPMKYYYPETMTILYINAEEHPLEIHTNSSSALFYPILIPD